MITYYRPISLLKAPLLSQFIHKLFSFAYQCNQMPVFKYLKWQKEISITGISDDCTKVYLKKSKYLPRKFIDRSPFIINTNQGIFLLHSKARGVMVMEALCYNNFPYKTEAKHLLRSNIYLSNLKELIAIKKYFHNLKLEEIKMIVVNH